MVDPVNVTSSPSAASVLERAAAPHEHLVEPALAAWRPHYEAHCLDRTRAYPGIPALLAGAGRALAVFTNKPGSLARKILDGLGLLARFTAVIGGDEAPRKPDPAGVRLIQDRVGARPDETVFVGDSRIDVATAQAAGVRMVAVTWGLVPRAELVRAGATELVDHAAELARLVA